MLIANPIYDVVFKRLMENERVAKYFISTLLDEEVVSVSLRPQEFTYTDSFARLAVFRLDFVALIKTDSGETKKVLIEIQKAKNHIDLMRFRNYLAEQYKKEEDVDGDKQALPITTIYILGFLLPELPSACLHVERRYIDMVEGVEMEGRSEFTEKLTHDSYIVQVRRITDRYQSRLDKLLSLFEQSNFLEEGEVLKEYKHEADNEDIQLMANILHHSGTDSETRKLIDAEQEAWRSVEALMYKERKSYKKKVEELKGELDEKDKALDEKDKALDEKDKALDEKDRLIEELKRRLKGN